MCGIRLPQVGRERKTGWKQERRQNTTAEKYKFVTFVLSKMKLTCRTQKSKSKDTEKKIKDKTPRDLEPADTTVHICSEGPTVQLCGTVWDQWRVSSGNEVQGKIGQFQKTLHSWWKRKVAKPISNIDSFVKHVYREHN